MNEHINTKKVQSHNSIIEKQDHTKQTTAIESKHIPGIKLTAMLFIKLP